MHRHLAPLATLMGLLALGGCAYQTEAQINADLARHVGQSDTDLVREMGVPTRTFDTNGHRFLAYYKGEQRFESDNFGGFGGYGGGFGGFGGWGWGGGYGGYGGFGGFSTGAAYNVGCATTFEVSAGRVVGFSRHGNAC